MKYKIIKSLTTKQKILTIALHNNTILAGGTSKVLTSYNIATDTPTKLYEFTKSVRSLSVNNKYIACGSYDGTVVIFTPTPILIEGPDTEIKGISLSNHNMLAVATRGKTVWIYKLNNNVRDEGTDNNTTNNHTPNHTKNHSPNTNNTPYHSYELHCILNDHTQDVKGVKWLNTSLYSYGYDCTIKRYATNIINSNYELLQDIQDCRNTIWDITFTDDTTMIGCTEDGYLYFYTLGSVWMLKCKIFSSNYPIYSLCSYKDCIFYVLNRRSVGVVDTQFRCKEIFTDLHFNDINSLFYCEESNMLVTGSDDGIINLIKIED